MTICSGSALTDLGKIFDMAVGGFAAGQTVSARRAMARGSVRSTMGAEAGVWAAVRFTARVKNRAAKPAPAVKPSIFSKKVLRDGSWLTACDLMG